MSGTVTMRRGRGRIAAVVMGVSALAAAALTLSFGAPPATASPVRDADPTTAAALALQIVSADAVIRINAAGLPGAEAKAAFADAAVAAAVAEEVRVHATGAAAPGVGTGDVASAAASALLDDLAPEQVSASRLAAERAAAAADAYRDQVRANLATALQQKVAALTSLSQQSQRRTWWCVTLLDGLGAPVTTENLRGLFAWIDAESNAASLRNPLATTQGAPGAHDANSVGVKGYPTDEIGIAATLQTLRNGHYQAILDAFARGDSAFRITSAVAASPWGTGVNATIRLLQSGG